MGEETRSAAELEAEGWERGCVADRARIPDLVDTYDEIGFDVVLLPVPLDDEGCTECMKSDPDNFRVIYTKRRSS